jgi:hypothetical protein
MEDSFLASTLLASYEKQTFSSVYCELRLINNSYQHGHLSAYQKIAHEASEHKVFLLMPRCFDTFEVFPAKGVESAGENYEKVLVLGKLNTYITFIGGKDEAEEISFRLG